MNRNAELTRKRDKPKKWLTVYEKASEWRDLRDELAQAITFARRYSRLGDAYMGIVEWSQAPTWAQWYAVDQHGRCWFEAEPDYGGGKWRVSDADPKSRHMQAGYDGGPVMLWGRPVSAEQQEVTG